MNIEGIVKRETLEDRRVAQRRKMAALVRAMTKAEAMAFLEGGIDYRRKWMPEHLDGQWGQSIASQMCRMVAKKLKSQK